MANHVLSGGDKLAAKLAEIAKKLESKKTLNVGFLEDATYGDDMPVAQVAFWNEFGATANVPEHTVDVYRQTNKQQTAFSKNGRFVKKKAANFVSTHIVPAHEIVIPPRPFFRTMVKDGSPHWGDDLGAIIPAVGYDAGRALGLMGAKMAAELKESIRDMKTPPNAPSTIAQKGFDNPLIDTGTMLKAPNFEVEE